MKINMLENSLKIKNWKLKITFCAFFLFTFSLFLLPSNVEAFTITRGQANTLGLIGWWTFDGKDMPSGKVNDVSGNGNHGSAINIATSTFYTVGKIGQGLKFDGADDHIQTTSNFIGTTAISVCMWLLPPSVPAETFVSNGKLIFGSSSSNRIKLLSDGSTTANSATNSVTNNKWNFICGTRDTSGTANLYVNGTLSGTANQSSGTPTAGIASVRIGGAVTGGGYLIGSIDDLRIYNRVLSVGEIQQLYNLGR